MMKKKNVSKAVSSIFSAVVLISLSNNFAFAGRFASVMLVGNLKGGKTQIFRRLCGNNYNGDDPNVTQESTEATHTILDLKDDQNQPVAITRLYDTPGMDRYYDAVVEMARHCNIAVIVHDTTQETDEEKGRENAEYFSRLFRDLHHRMPVGGQIFLAGSKIDDREDNAIVHSKNCRMLSDVAQFLNCRLCFVSAKTGEGLGDLMNHIKTALSGINLPVADIEDIYNSYQLIPDPALTGQIDSLTADRARLEAEKAQLNTRITALNDQVNTLNGQKTRVENEKTQLDARVAELNGQVNTLNREKSQALNDKQFLQTRKGELESENSTLRSRISALEDEKAELNRRINAVETEKSELSRRINAVETDKSELSRRVKTLENRNIVKRLFNTDF